MRKALKQLFIVIYIW